jgi:hypothetical protein
MIWHCGQEWWSAAHLRVRAGDVLAGQRSAAALDLLYGSTRQSTLLVSDSIDVLAVAYVDDRDNMGVVVDSIDDPVGSTSSAEPVIQRWQ